MSLPVVSARIYAFICTRYREGMESTEDFNPTLKNLCSYLSRAGAQVNILIGENSIFEAYSKAFNKVKPSDQDIIILCHDDIEILNDVKTFSTLLREEFKNLTTGFVGVAGSKTLTRDAVWWTRENFENRQLHGIVFHGESKESMVPSYYGDFYGKVIAMDGLFLAARASTLREIGLKKPKEYPGEWDFYDIYYTTEAWKKGYTNKVLPILVRHESKGESMYTRDSWDKNREIFIRNNKLPLRCS